jgi:hypothetical protein
MSALLFALLASGCAALSNLLFHKNSIRTESNANGYLLFFYLSSLIFSFLLYPSISSESLNYLMLTIGISVGLLNMTLMLLTSRALQKGPAGLTFAFQNTSAVFPGMILFLLLGVDYGFSFSIQQLLGILLVVIGLFLGSKSASNQRPIAMFQWLKYALACTVVQVLALTLIQCRCIFLDPVNPVDSLASRADVSFLLGQFGVAFLFQLGYFLYQKNSLPRVSIIYGSLGGAANFFSTFLLLLATQWALPYEKGILFPCFAVGTIVISNIWANRLYGEKFNIASNATCACGILMGLT